MRSRLLVVPVIAVAAVAATAASFYARGRGVSPKYRVARVERGPVKATVSATGNLNAVITVQVGSQVSGQIKEIFVDFNSQVEKGQLIARIDPSIFESKVSQARADVENAQATVLNQAASVEKARADVDNARAALAGARAQTAKAQVTLLDARRDLDRKTELLRKEFIAQSDRDTSQATHDAAAAQLESTRAQEQALASQIRSAEAQLAVAQAQLKAAQAQLKQKKAGLDQAQVDLDHTQIRAPVDGVVVSRNVDVGQTVAASLQAPTLFTIAQDLTRMQVDTNVDEADVGRIRLGQRASFTVDAFRGQTFSGEVVQIRKAAQVIQNVVTYDAVVSAPNKDLTLLPGMTASVKIVVDERPSVLKVPNAALHFRPPGVEAGQPGSADAKAGRTREPADGKGESLESIRQRLARGLGLTEEQQRKLEPILQERQQKLLALEGASLPKAERRSRRQEIGETARKRIVEILTGEQRPRFEPSMLEHSGAGREGVSGRVWVPGADGEPRPLTLQLGLADANFTEVLEGEVREGQEVIVGLAERPAPRSGGDQGSTSPGLSF